MADTADISVYLQEDVLLSQFRTSLTPKDQYITQRARGAYIASVCQPEASFDLSFAAQVINPVEDDTKNLNKRLSWQIEKDSVLKVLKPLYGMAHGFDIGAAIKSTLDKILQINLPLILCTNSKSLYNFLVRLGTTQEKRLMIDVMCLRQAYERRQVTKVKWIDGDTNPADAMTKGKPYTALSQLIDTNRVELQAVGWVERTDSARA
jgi:hypothetical protein